MRKRLRMNLNRVSAYEKSSAISREQHKITRLDENLTSPAKTVIREGNNGTPPCVQVPTSIKREASPRRSFSSSPPSVAYARLPIIPHNNIRLLVDPTYTFKGSRTSALHGTVAIMRLPSTLENPQWTGM